MTIPEMHVWFRQYAQQMGMQNVRAILPEQIDLLINTSIIDIVNQIITSSVAVTNDRIITDNSKIGQINALSSLYTVKEFECFGTQYSETGKAIFKTSSAGLTASSFFNIGTLEDLTGSITLSTGGLWLVNTSNSVPKGFYLDSSLTGKSISAQTLVENIKNGTYTHTYYDIPTFTLSNKTKGLIKLKDLQLPYLYLVDFSLSYKQGTISSEDKATYISNGEETNYFPIRLIEDSFLADTLNDFVLKNRLRSPILTIYKERIINDGESDEETIFNDNIYLKDNLSFDLYIDKFSGTTAYSLANSLIPYKFRIAYIAKPATVRYAEDIGGTNVDCNLPSYLHIDILKHAVDLYRQSVGGGAQPQQQQQAAPQQAPTEAQQ